MIPFRVEFRPGTAISEQIVYAATKAVVSGRLRPGDAFPSVRNLSRELKINPNTAHKVITQLITTGLLEAVPGTGTIVARLPETTNSQRTYLLQHEVEQIVVEAKRLGVGCEQVLASVKEHWKRLGTKDSALGFDREGAKR